MSKETGRNDPCPCGSGKKYKACCWIKNQAGVRKKISARLLSGKVNLMERAFGSAVSEAKPLPSSLSNHKVEEGQVKETPPSLPPLENQ